MIQALIDDLKAAEYSLELANASANEANEAVSNARAALCSALANKAFKANDGKVWTCVPPFFLNTFDEVESD